MEFNVSNMTNFPQQSFDLMNDIGTNPVVIIVLVVIIGVYYLFFALLGNKSSDGNYGEGSVVFIEALLWGLFIVLILLNGVTYFFNIDISSSIKNIFSDTPEISVNVNNKVGDIGSNKNNSDNTLGNTSLGNTSSRVGISSEEVFNIPGNEYTYLDAQALCKAYDSELATYEQIFDAYKNGAEWCNYGWSENQMAFFPTQKNTWEKLQNEKGHENDCGRIGINGGYIANPNVRFGVNCFGAKPKITTKESKLMQNQQLVPQTMNDVEIDKRVQQFRNTNINDILISPFNRDTWTRI
tara:strand:+ start:5250 stop:6137 length:888 start_codon:yes stop_codon:yes gene_type:complete